MSSKATVSLMPSQKPAASILRLKTDHVWSVHSSSALKSTLLQHLLFSQSGMKGQINASMQTAFCFIIATSLPHTFTPLSRHTHTHTHRHIYKYMFSVFMPGSQWVQTMRCDHPEIKSHQIRDSSGYQLISSFSLKWTPLCLTYRPSSFFWLGR